MSDTREILDKIFNGKMLIKRYMPRPGESPYYYLDPFYTDDYSTISDFGIIDVPDGVHPSSSVLLIKGITVIGSRRVNIPIPLLQFMLIQIMGTFVFLRRKVKTGKNRQICGRTLCATVNIWQTQVYRVCLWLV